MRLARTETLEHTVTGLLAKRADLFNEAERIRDRPAEIKNDIGALDGTLSVLGYTDDLDAAMPLRKREVIFLGAVSFHGPSWVSYGTQQAKPMRGLQRGWRN